MIAAFWASVALILQTYLIFPATVLARGRWRPRPHQTGPVTPSVTVVIAAHNEAAGIGAKLRSVVDGDYPPELLQVVVASDGSDDDTVEAATLGDPRVHVLDLDRVGKAAALNAAVAEAVGDVVVFTDANSRFMPSTIRELVRPFADPHVGGVAGDQRYDDSPEPTPTGQPSQPGVGQPEVGATAHGERRYWDLDRKLKAAESAGGNVIGATGALYALRRELIELVPDGVTDDFTTSTGVIARGWRLVFAPDAAVYEPVAASADAEFRRKVRVMTRGLQAVAHRRILLDPTRHGFYAYQLANHKVLRRLMALPLITLLAATIGCWGRGPLYRLALAGQAAVYVPGTIGLAWPQSRLGRSRVCGLTSYFCLVNAAGVVAAYNVISGRRIDRWQPERAAIAGPDRSEARS